METMLSIIIPTHNRSADVLENLAALVPQCRDQPIEIIVVDSASKPAEAAFLREAAKDGGFKLIRMDAPGASRARNAGIALAKGPWLGFLDDDAVPHSDWVARAMSRINASAENVGVIAGRALPRWPDKPVARGFKPEDLGPRARILVSIIDDPDVYRCEGAPLGISANLLLRKEALAKIGGFPVSMGRVKNSLASGEDPYVMDEIVKRGYVAWYDGTMCVDHKIQPKQLTTNWIARRSWHEGMVSLRRSAGAGDRTSLVLKCLASLPALLLMHLARPSNTDYAVRFYHNLGLVCGRVAEMRPGRPFWRVTPPPQSTATP
jgi:glycosyltransferase involved in cell wall biosynthesis